MRNNLSNAQYRLLAVVLTIAGYVGINSTGALAQTEPYDPTAGQYEAQTDNLLDFITNVATSPLFLIAAAAIGIGVALSYFRKGGSQAKRS